MCANSFLFEQDEVDKMSVETGEEVRKEKASVRTLLKDVLAEQQRNAAMAKQLAIVNDQLAEQDKAKGRLLQEVGLHYVVVCVYSYIWSDQV